MINILKFCPVLSYALYNQFFQTLFMNILVSCLCITWNKQFNLSYMFYFLISKWAGYKLPGIKVFFCGLGYVTGLTAVKDQDQLQDTSWTQFCLNLILCNHQFLLKSGFS